MDPFALASRSVIHVDIDSFFLAVHMRQDATLDASKPLVLWQYQDVVCANRPAKALGVKKHMRPSEARALVDKNGGRLVHAFCRTWPGPRVDYSNYNSASREFFRAFADALRVATGGAGVAVERASIDEGFAEVQRGSRALCARVRAFVEERTGLKVSVGCGPNKLLAKLASSAAKGSEAGVLVVDGAAAVERFLAKTPARRLPGCDAPGTCADHARVASGKLRDRCRGVDDAPVASRPAASVMVTSWTTHAAMSDLCRTEGDGFSFPRLLGGAGGRWVFAPHPKTDAPVATNETRRFWILLALSIDLEERLRHDFEATKRRPRRLTVSVQGCGADPLPMPGNDYRAGGVNSRSVAFPTNAAPEPDPASEADLCDRIRGGVDDRDEFDVPPGLYRRVHAIADAAAQVLRTWARDEGDRRVAQLTLCASQFSEAPAASPITALFKAAPLREPAPRRPDEAAPTAADVDPSVLAALPSDVRSAVEAEMAAERRARRPAASTPPAKKKARTLAAYFKARS